MNNKLVTLLIILSCAFNYSIAQYVDTVSIYSNKMRKAIPCVVIKPAQYNSDKLKYPVVYLLHGYAGNYSNWIKKVPELTEYATTMQLLIVCPDGGFGSWYLDSPIDTTYQYQTFVSKELPNYIDAHYSTKANANSRALTGLSMGGHGGIYVGLQYPHTFGAIGSMSGALDITYIKNRFDVNKRLGDSTLNAINFTTHSNFAMIDTLKPTNQAIIIDCGTDDFVLPFNEVIHQKLLKRKIAHDYILRPGNHNWEYWRNAVSFQLYFFKKYFDRKIVVPIPNTKQ